MQIGIISVTVANKTTMHNSGGTRQRTTHAYNRDRTMTIHHQHEHAHPHRHRRIRHGMTTTKILVQQILPLQKGS